MELENKVLGILRAQRCHLGENFLRIYPGVGKYPLPQVLCLQPSLQRSQLPKQSLNLLLGFAFLRRCTCRSCGATTGRWSTEAAKVVSKAGGCLLQAVSNAGECLLMRNFSDIPIEQNWLLIAFFFINKRCNWLIRMGPFLFR